MRFLVVDFWQIPDAGHLWKEYLQQRFQAFVEEKNWFLPHARGIEFDPYDTPNALYVIVEHGGHCVGGARVMRTDRRQYGQYTYMIGDFATGVIKGVSPETVPQPPIRNQNTVEATRFFVDRGLPKDLRSDAYGAVVDGVLAAATMEGSTTVLALMPRAIYRVFRRIGFDVREHKSEEILDGKAHSVGFLSVPSKASSEDPRSFGGL